MAALTRFLAERGANILQSDQHTTDPEGGQFFMRTEFKLDGLEDQADAFEAAFAAEVAEPFGMDWRMRYASQRKRVAIFVSRYDHCLAELLWRWRRGELYADIPLVISNHAEMEREAARFDVRFEHVPVDTRHQAGGRGAHLELLGGTFDLIVLARYMQILSRDFLDAARSPIINIHHSFLPAFAGAEPVRAGVRARGEADRRDRALRHRGARCRPDHRAGRRARHAPRDDRVARRAGADIERTVLARAVGWHLEDRVLAYGNRTIVF